MSIDGGFHGSHFMDCLHRISLNNGSYSSADIGVAWCMLLHYVQAKRICGIVGAFE